VAHTKVYLHRFGCERVDTLTYRRDAHRAGVLPHGHTAVARAAAGRGAHAGPDGRLRALLHHGVEPRADVCGAGPTAGQRGGASSALRPPGASPTPLGVAWVHLCTTTDAHTHSEAMGATQTLEEVWTDVQTIADALHAPQKVRAPPPGPQSTLTRRARVWAGRHQAHSAHEAMPTVQPSWHYYTPPTREGEGWVGVPQGHELMQSLRRRIATAADAARGRRTKRVTCIQWTHPVYAAGAWVPELIRMAGGEDTTCTPGGPSLVLSGAPSPSLALRLPLRLPHRLSHCVSHCVSLAVSRTASPTAPPSPSLALRFPLRLPRRLSHCVALAVSPTAFPTAPPSPSLALLGLPLRLSHRLSHCVALAVSRTASPTASPAPTVSHCVSPHAQRGTWTAATRT
jgi:hypothetical protein